MAALYQQIESNKRKTWVLISLYGIVIILLGWAFGYSLGDQNLGIIMAVVFSTIMTLIGFYKGDAVALASSGAKQIEKSKHPELYRLVENLAITAGLQTPKIYVINDPSPNAFAAGRDPEHASIAVTTGLLQIMTKAELEGVLAHEMSHVKNYDIRVMTLTVVLVGVIMLLSDWLLRTFLFGDRDRGDARIGFALVIVGITLAVLSPIFAELIKLAISRSREYLADASGILLTRHPDGLASALEKIAKYDRPLKKPNHATAHLFLANPFDPHVTKKFERFFSSHPPILERISRLRRM